MTTFQDCSIAAYAALEGDCTPEDADAIARAVLMALREASNTQYAAGVDALQAPNGCLFAAFTAMIDAVLAEAPKT